jgi:N-acyl-D-amino-acid deacylase
MTNLSATNIGLKDRGVIKEGAFADIVMFDARNTKDNSTFSNSTLQSEGIHSLWVNGIRVLSNGEYTFAVPGRILSKND